MKLTRNEADLVLRHYTHEYAQQMTGFDDDAPRISTLARELSYYIDADVNPTDIAWLLVSWRAVIENLPNAEHDVNYEVNQILDNAGFTGTHQLRYTEQETAA